MDGSYSSVFPQPSPRQLVVSVTKVREGSQLAPGQVFELFVDRVLIGRDPVADVRLNDRTVSRQHAVIRDEGGGLVLQNVSERGSTFVDGQAVAIGQIVGLATPECSVQVGGVLLRVLVVEHTTAVHSAMSLEQPRVLTVSKPGLPERRPSAMAPLLELEWDAGRCHVRVHGRLMTLYPAPAKALAALAATPGQPVHRFDLEEALGEEASVEQQISILRRAFSELVTTGVLSLDELRARVRVHSSGPHLARLDGMDDREVLRHFIGALRGYGYVLCLGPDDVRWVEGGT